MSPSRPREPLPPPLVRPAPPPSPLLTPLAGPLLVLLLAAAAWTLQFALTFRGLEASDAFNYAQIARNVARGDGYVTQEAMPQEFLFFRDVPHPEIMHPPLQALAVAAFFALVGPQETAAVLPGGLAYLLVAPLVYVAARRWAGKRAGIVSAILFLTHPKSADYAVSGLAEPLYALLLAVAVILVARTRDEHRWAVTLPLGALFGLADLARETTRYLLPVAALFLWGARPGRGARLGGLAFGYLLVALPNHFRIAAAAGHPFASHLGAILMCGIPPFDGLDWYRSMSPVDPFAYLARAPHLLLEKMAFNIVFLIATFGRIMSPLLVLGALAAWRLAPDPEARRAAAFTAAAFLVQVGVTALFLVDHRHFAPFVPLLAILAGVAAESVHLRAGGIGRTGIGRTGIRRAGHLIAIVALAGLFLIQGRGCIRQLVPADAGVLAHRRAERQLGEWVAARTHVDDLVITDISEIIAWTADRRTAWYPLDETLLDRIPNGGRGEVYLLLTTVRVIPEPVSPRFGARRSEPWVRYLQGSGAPPGFEVAGEFSIDEIAARLFRRRDSAAAG